MNTKIPVTKRIEIFIYSVSILVISLFWNIKQVSLAYSNSSQSAACGISFIYKRNGSGPKMDPWGTLYRRFLGSEKVWTLIFLFDR